MPRCKICGSAPVMRATKHWYFRLSQFQERLAQWQASKLNWKSNVREFCTGWFSEGLTDRPITRDIDWGIPVPLPEAKGKVLYVWFDAPHRLYLIDGGVGSKSGKSRPVARLLV